MNSSKRMVVNTLVQYLRSIINTVLSLFSTRIILDALGVEDYGIYAVVGGVVSMIGFINNALSTTTQRYISYYYSQIEKAKKIFTNSLLIHFVFTFVIIAILLSIAELVVCHWLVIDADRIQAARYVYVIVSVILGVGIMTTPFRALLIAHENITYISIIEICDGILKFAFAFILLYVPFDKLIVYSLIMLLMQTFNLVAFMVYCSIHYDECILTISRKDIDKGIIKKLTGFIGWTTYSMGVIAGRNQGIAILLNQAFGVVTNAAYGIAVQIYASVAFVATSVLNAMNPQIMKAEGEHNREKMLHLATLESKYSTALLLLCCVPAVFEMESILTFWLKDVPEGAVMFCQMILCSFICDQLTYGLNTANQATGIIRNYIIIIYTPKLILLGLVALCLHYGGTAFHVMLLYLFVEVLSAMLRIPYLHHTCGLNVHYYIKNVFVPLFPLVLAETVVCWLMTNYIEIPFRFMLTLILSTVIGGGVCWYVVLNKESRQSLLNMIHRKIR